MITLKSDTKPKDYFGTCYDCGMKMNKEDFSRHELTTCEEYKKEVIKCR